MMPLILTSKKTLIIIGSVLLIGAAVLFSPKLEKQKWTKIAELSSKTGNKYVVGQQHYDWVEGWAVHFFWIDTSVRIHGASLQIETRPWRRVHLTEEERLVKIWREGHLVAWFDLSSGLVHNRLKNSVGKISDGETIPNALFTE